MESLLWIHDPGKVDSCLVEVVLLGQPGVMDALRPPDLPVGDLDQPLLLADEQRCATASTLSRLLLRVRKHREGVRKALLLADGITSTSVVVFLEEHFGFRHEFLGIVAAMVVGSCVLFAVVCALAIKYLNFQRIQGLAAHHQFKPNVQCTASITHLFRNISLVNNFLSREGRERERERIE